MTMQVASVDTILAEQGFAPPVLRALVPDQANYKVLLFQPEGNLTADTHGVRNSDAELAEQQFSAFLRTSLQHDVQLAITPEYSLPWKVLEEALQADVTPANSAIWALGCESITSSELSALADRLADKARFIYENCDGDGSRFLNPLVYVFHTSTQASSPADQTIVLVQFKTCPLGDNQHYEVNGLLCGSRLYCFGGTDTQLRLITLVCSDAFAFSESHAQDLYDRTLVIHIQLNANPRQYQFRTYRTHLFQYGGDATELITLNWARGIQADLGEGPKCWNNIAGSGWYLRPDRFELGDAVLHHNHKLGLYYTWLEPDKCHALFFSYEPAVFLITATKVAHRAVAASLSRRIGPKMDAAFSWNPDSRCWEEDEHVEDGFSRISSDAGEAERDLTSLAQLNPFAVERLVALCAGLPITAADWYTVKKLDSCRIDTSEIVQRVTVCHDVEVSAVHFRRARLRACQRVARLLGRSLPPSLSDLAEGFRFDWNAGSPHANISSNSGRRATVVALDNNHTREDAEQLRATLAEYLRRTALSDDASLDARQRLHIWYQDDQGQDALCSPHQYARYDQTTDESPFDIGRAS